MHSDPYLFQITAMILFLLVCGLVLHFLKQSSVIAYLLSGVLIGPFGFELIESKALLEHLGSFGVVLLLFFIGLEIDPREIIKNWKVSFVGTFLQILISVGCLLALGRYFDWSLQRSIFLGFAISLSSTAVVVQYLKESGQMGTQVGKDVLGILIAQDVALIPMMIVIGTFSKSSIDFSELGMQAAGAAILIVALVLAIRFGAEKHRFLDLFKKDKDIQVLGALSFALGLSLFSGLFHLSSALGAFFAGAIVRAFKQNNWVHEALVPLRVIFLGIFFASVGALVDLNFLRSNILIISLTTFFALSTNTFVNMLVLKFLGRTWKESFYAGSILSQVGEFSFVLAAIGLSASLITSYTYNLIIIMVFLSMVLTPGWISLVARVTKA